MCERGHGRGEYSDPRNNVTDREGFPERGLGREVSVADGADRNDRKIRRVEHRPSLDQSIKDRRNKDQREGELNDALHLRLPESMAQALEQAAEVDKGVQDYLPDSGSDFGVNRSGFVGG